MILPNRVFSTHTLECVDDEFETLICKVLPFYCLKTDTIYFKDPIELGTIELGTLELSTLVGSLQDAYKLLFTDPYCFFSSSSLNTFFLSQSISLKESLIAAIIELDIIFPSITMCKVRRLHDNFYNYYFSRYDHDTKHWIDYSIVQKMKVGMKEFET